MSTFEEERERDFAAYEAMKQEILANHRGEYIAIAGGRLVKIAPTFDEAWDAVKGHRHALVFRGGSEPKRGIVRIRWLTG